MRCCLIFISNSRYSNCFDEQTNDAVAAALESDVRQVESAFRERFRNQSVEVRRLVDLNRNNMAGLERKLYALATPTGPEEQPVIQDGDFVVLWVAGYGMSIRGSDSAVLLPVDVRSREAPLQSSLADQCSIKNKILAPVRNINRAGVVHLVLNLFHERNDYSPVVEPSCISGKNLHILASFATSPEQVLGTANEAGTSPLCSHYCSALIGGTRSSSSSIEDVCREAIRGVSEEMGELLVPWVWHNLVKPSAGTSVGPVAEFVWMAAGPADAQDGSSGAAAPAVPQEVHSTQGSSGGVAVYGSNVMSMPTEVAPASEWSFYRRHRGPLKMRVAEIRVESQVGRAFQMPTDEALIAALGSFAEEMDFVGFSVGPDRVEIYESCSRDDLVTACTKRLGWNTYVRRPGSHGGLCPAGSRIPSVSWVGANVESRSAVHDSQVPAATLTFEEDHGHEGYLGFKDNAFLAALRMLCDQKVFTAASVGVGEGGWLDPVEVNPPQDKRKHSSIFDGNSAGLLDGHHWHPSHVQHGEWMLLDLGETQLVHGLVIQGAQNFAYPNKYVTQVKVDCGLMENDLWPVVEDSSDNVANMVVAATHGEVNGKARVDFPLGPVLARYVKVWPIKWSTDPDMRVGVCAAKKRTDGGVKVQLYKAASKQQLLRHRVQDDRSTLYLR